MQPSSMNLKLLLPHQVLIDKTGVTRIVAESEDGSFGLLPHRLDCVAVLVPGILVFETEEEGEVSVAVDDGVLVKTGQDVLVSVRSAVIGTDLAKLHQVVETEFSVMNEQEQNVKSVMAKMENNFIRRLIEVQNE